MERGGHEEGFGAFGQRQHVESHAGSSPHFEVGEVTTVWPIVCLPHLPSVGDKLYDRRHRDEEKRFDSRQSQAPVLHGGLPSPWQKLLHEMRKKAPNGQ